VKKLPIIAVLAFILWKMVGFELLAAEPETQKLIPNSQLEIAGDLLHTGMAIVEEGSRGRAAAIRRDRLRFPKRRGSEIRILVRVAANHVRIRKAQNIVVNVIRGHAVAHLLNDIA